MDMLLFGALPYVAFAIFVIGSIYRYQNGFKYSSLSSQLLETEKLFSASVAFHMGIIVIFLGHFIGFFFPSLFSSIGGTSLVILEIVGVMFGVLAIIGLVMLFIRRVTTDRIKVVTNRMDLVIEVLLILQFILGVVIAIEMKWGSSWYASNMVPYLHSIFAFNPDIAGMVAMPILVKLHVVGAFLIILLIPFSRLVHFLVAPFHYITRPYQVVRWNWNRKTIRDPKTSWDDIQRPKNN
ncbi:respiratory nitrate reductase subunit gamma [Sulfurovum sp. bin170]|uniref:respiratory nitrate reductase subunit gamma n=1 Tax=Sulfurovum sp. bin170 TaxID=2695268 RepID=UPI0013E0358F|nr:respiratory nitrate reductase subunit gamma [Sulfurovum sp. bin170]NEW60218.1 respiratory nitrate reductase subunit gamma [Sulfurovum sp. bin170]